VLIPCIKGTAKHPFTAAEEAREREEEEEKGRGVKNSESSNSLTADSFAWAEHQP
jgi:hypothetical protein